MFSPKDKWQKMEFPRIVEKFSYKVFVANASIELKFVT